MTTGRTADISVYLGSANALGQVTHLLGLSVNGEADVTNEAFLNQELEAASVHAVKTVYEFSTLFDSDEVDGVIGDMLASNVYGTGPASTVQLAVFEDGGPLEHFQIHPVQFTRPGYAAPPADSITRDWSFMPAGRGGHGFVVESVSTDADGSAVSVLAASDDRADGGLTHVWVLVTQVGAGATNVKLVDGSADIDLTASEGIQGPFTLSATDQALTADSDTADVSMVVLVGGLEPLPVG